MNDEETVALIAGGHTFGKTHGAADPEEYVGPEPEAAPIETGGMGWLSKYGSGVGKDAITSGLEVTWTDVPTQWSNRFFEILFEHEWELSKSPAGAAQWVAKDSEAIIPAPDEGGAKRKPTMLTTDLALRMDPAYEQISRRFLENPDEFADAFARAWFKLTHRDMGPVARYVGPEVPSEELIWQDPIPAPAHTASAETIAAVKQKIADSGLTVSQLVSTAWAAASSYRHSDKRGGANGGRIRLEPQRSWEVNDPQQLAGVITVLEGIADGARHHLRRHGRAGRQRRRRAGGGRGRRRPSRCRSPRVAATPPRSRPTSSRSRGSSRRPTGSATSMRSDAKLPAEYLLVDKANLLNVTAPEMTVLVGGLRVLGANTAASTDGVLTERPGQLTNDFFVNLLDLGTVWAPAGSNDRFEASTGRQRLDRARAPTWSSRPTPSCVRSRRSTPRTGREEKFVHDFVAAWAKVMDNDRYDVRR